MQDPDQYCEEKGDVADLCSLTGLKGTGSG
jgi:hypothetical protein